RAKTIEQEFASHSPSAKFSFISLELKSVIDYDEIFLKIKSAAIKIVENLNQEEIDISILLDPGTPQMQTCWFLLARSGFLKADLFQGIPPQFSGGIYKYRIVNPDSKILPEIHSHERGKAGGNNKCTNQWITGSKESPVRGISKIYQEILDKAVQVSKYDISVLITGETGTGKGVIAKMIHDSSSRSAMPFLPVNCSGISVSLAESEFFGHVKGSFTGADRSRTGQFRAAEGGTIFLDEIGDLPLEIQPKLLRVLEEKVVLPVGGEKEHKINVRIIAATNKDLPGCISSGNFRRDLYERLNQITIIVPPLREHSEDINELASKFISEWNNQYREEKYFSSETSALLTKYSWPGNIRQLRNTVFSLCASSVSNQITPDLLPQEILSYFKMTGVSSPLEITIPEEGFNIKTVIYNYEKDIYVKALEMTNGNRENAAKLLGLNPPAFRKALRERFSIAESGT
ncbi:MAG: sigma-54 dependent transcriptional regulator, partial [Spirochaetia bacterium]|nr:sigma-54 dependent transcriptional regulator [Spirochaetia bacterium]